MFDKEEINIVRQGIEDFGKEIEEKKIDFKSKMSVDDDGILRLELAEDTESMIKDMELIVNHMKNLENKMLFGLLGLVKVNQNLKIVNYEIRKKIAKLLKDLMTRSSFKKVAMYGNNVVMKVALSFVLPIIGLKNIRHFDTEKEAIEWLKEE